MRRCNGLVEVIQRAVESLESGNQDRHRVRFAACHYRGNRDILYRNALARRSGRISKNCILRPWAVLEHFLVTGLRRRNDRKSVTDVHLIEIVVDLFHVCAGLSGFLLADLRHKGQDPVSCRCNLVNFEIDVGEFKKLVAVLSQRADNVIPLQIYLLSYFLNCAALVNIHRAEAQVACPVDADAFGNSGSRRCGHVYGRNAELFKGNGNYRCGRGGSHVAECDNSRRWFFLCEHRRVLVKTLLILSANGLGIFHIIRNAQLCQTFLDAVKHSVIIAESKFCVVVEQDFTVSQFIQ